jgi:hypothetical protein
MAYIITYRKNNETHTLEWIVPTGWSTIKICKSFEQQYPQAELIELKALQ